MARVDQEWGRPLREPVSPQLPPQSHWVNARTNPRWLGGGSGGSVRAQVDFVSETGLALVRVGGGAATASWAVQPATLTDRGELLRVGHGGGGRRQLAAGRGANHRLETAK